ncbi:TetR/AcrR family transcriptional regulator [Saccharothrix syringae]|uniref:TetR/AcrR family transcriptional regulator n=1 Tax=Saccharothrix syringae TaxID=103733 RepID=A0A5Q0H9A6_SACSY|nr:TetR/AcrR family transcriptional regulator [Saccharothrix syringae]QFZ22410.1 TetR/AcrR family transcriptional regulator [Saccharothrix syringae]
MSPTGGTPRLRRDAQRNVEKLKAAAIEVFRERGLTAPLEDIASRAGVSTGTLYNRFGSREALIDAVVPELASVRLAHLLSRVRGAADPWRRFVAYVEGMAALQAEEPVLNDLVSRRFPDATELTRVCDEALAEGARLVDEAKRHGSLRADFTAGDLFVALWCTGQFVRATRATAPDAWRRNIAIFLDGARAEAARELPVGPEALVAVRDSLFDHQQR